MLRGTAGALTLTRPTKDVTLRCYLAWRVRCAYPPYRGCGVEVLSGMAGALTLTRPTRDVALRCYLARRVRSRLPALHNKTYELCRVGKRSAPTTVKSEQLRQTVEIRLNRTGGHVAPGTWPADN